MSPGHALSVAGAVKRYGSASALNGVDIRVAPGEFTVLLGPSGSGKSTLLRAVAGIERLDGGSIALGGECVSDARRHVPANRRDLAMVFQDYALWPHLTALGNVLYALRRRRLDGRAARARAHEALSRVGLGGYADRYPHELSGGEQQRVGLARAVVADPALVLLDEPLSNLDADLRERLRVEIATTVRQTGSTALYITHDQAEAFALADRVGVLRAGRLEQLGTPEQIYQSPASPFVARFTGVSGALRGSVVGRRGELLLVRCGDRQLGCRAGAGLRAGSAVTVLVRPAATRLDFADRLPPTDALPGTVVDIAYRGRGYDHVVVTAAGELAAVFDSNPWPRGTSCAVHLDPTGCTAFPEPATDASDITIVMNGSERLGAQRALAPSEGRHR